MIDGKAGVVGIPFFDEYVEKATIEYLDKVAKSGKPFFMSVNFMKVHQPNMPHPDFVDKSMSKSKYADSIVENDTRIGRVIEKVRELGLDKNTYIFWTTDNGAWQDVYPDAGYTPFRGTKGTVREGGNRVPAIAVGPTSSRGPSITRSSADSTTWPRLPRMAGVKLPQNDREGKPMIFDSYDLWPVLFGTGKSPRNEWFYFTENELSPGAVRRQLQVRVQPSWRQRAGHRRSRGRFQPRLERGGKICRHRAADIRPLAGPAGALRPVHEQLHREHMDGLVIEQQARKVDEDLHPVPAAQAAEHGL